MDTETILIRTTLTGSKGSCTPFDPLVDTETYICLENEHYKFGCTPFDPLVDTETMDMIIFLVIIIPVAPPSIRLWILKHEFNGFGYRYL